MEGNRPLCKLDNFRVIVVCQAGVVEIKFICRCIVIGHVRQTCVWACFFALYRLGLAFHYVGPPSFSQAWLCPNPPPFMPMYENPTDGESATTLVELPHLCSFVFNRSSVTNATIYSSARPLYQIKSSTSLSRTDLFDLNEHKTVASIKRRQFFSNLVVFAHRDNKSMRIGKWLKRRKVHNEQTSVLPRFL
jgi:hypothetical protein